jgi:hypothetical protein
MLHNERYRGVAIWNRTRKVRDPKTGRRIQRLRPRSEWTVVESPHLRIISDTIWQRVQSRLATVNAVFSSGRAAGLTSRSYTAEYLFSGFLICGLCGSNVVLISGRGGVGWVGWAKYGCPLHQNPGICSNALVVRPDSIEREIVKGLQREVLRDDVAAYALEEFKRQLQARLQGARSHLAVLRARREIDVPNLRGLEPACRTFGWCRGPESNWLRPPFQGGALPVSYPGTVESANFRGAPTSCQMKAGNSTWRGERHYHAKISRKETNCQEISSKRRPRTRPRMGSRTGPRAGP